MSSRFARTQFGVLIRRRFNVGTFVTMEDTTHDNYESAVREAMWLKREYNDDVAVLSVFSINLEDGEICQLMNGRQIDSLYNAIENGEWEYFWHSRDSLPVEKLNTAKELVK